MRSIRNSLWFLLGIAIAMLLVPALSFGGSAIAVSGSESNSSALGIGVGIGVGGAASSGASVSTTNQLYPSQDQFMQLKIDAPAGGVYRQFPENVQPLLPQTPNWFLGHVGKSWNILENLDMLPHILSREEAETLLAGRVSTEVRVIRKNEWQTDQVKLFKEMPVGSKLVGYVFAQSTDTTIDIVAKAALDAMKSGANGLVVLNRSVRNRPYGWGAGLGVGGGHSALGGASDKDQAFTSSGIIGFSYGSAGVRVAEGLVFMMVDTDPKPRVKRVVEVKPAVNHFRCVATGNYTPPADCK